MTLISKSFFLRSLFLSHSKMSFIPSMLVSPKNSVLSSIPSSPHLCSYGSHGLECPFSPWAHHTHLSSSSKVALLGRLCCLSLCLQGWCHTPSAVSLCTQCTALSSDYVLCGKVWLAHLSPPLGCEYYEQEYY